MVTYRLSLLKRPNSLPISDQHNAIGSSKRQKHMKAGETSSQFKSDNFHPYVLKLKQLACQPTLFPSYKRETRAAATTDNVATLGVDPKILAKSRLICTFGPRYEESEAPCAVLI